MKIAFIQILNIFSRIRDPRIFGKYSEFQEAIFGLSQELQKLHFWRIKLKRFFTIFNEKIVLKLLIVHMFFGQETKNSPK